MLIIYTIFGCCMCAWNAGFCKSMWGTQRLPDLGRAGMMMSARPPYPMPGMPYHGGLPMPGSMPAAALGPPLVPKVGTQAPGSTQPLLESCRGYGSRMLRTKCDVLVVCGTPPWRGCASGWLHA